jgi:hypothetical protein
MRIMADTPEPHTARPIRRDGWTPERRRRFLEFLAAGLDVGRACAGVGLSRQAAYTLRRRDPAFAEGWDGAMRSARAAAEQAWIAMLSEGLRGTMSELSGECELLGDAGGPLITLSELWRGCKLRGSARGFPHDDTPPFDEQTGDGW